MRFKKLLLSAASVAVIAGASQAQASGPYYVSLFGGVNILKDNSAHRSYTSQSGLSSFAHTGSVSEKSQTGFVLGGAAGVHLDSWLHGLRAEGEVSLRRNKIKGNWNTHITTQSFPSGSDSTTASGTLSGHMSTFAMMANVWYDVDVGMKLKPYFGGGVGWAHSQALIAAHTTFGGRRLSDGDESGFAYQLGAGLNYEIMPDVQIGVGYRYFVGPDVDVFFRGKNGTAVPFQIKGENQAVTLSITMRAP